MIEVKISTEKGEMVRECYTEVKKTIRELNSINENLLDDTLTDIDLIYLNNKFIIGNKKLDYLINKYKYLIGDNIEE